jgi:diguanylate cyclase (GGDEF)-like protein
VPAGLLLYGAVALATVLGLAWVRDGRRRCVGEALWAWLPLQVGIQATGALTSPLLPLFLAWIIVVGAAGSWLWAVGGAGVAILLLLAGVALQSQITVSGAAELGLLVGTGLGAAWLVHAVRGQATAERRALTRILEEARSGSGGRTTAAAAGRVEQLEASVAGARRRLGADRLTIWLLDSEAELARAVLCSGGRIADSVALSGAPFEWAWQEGVTLRLNTPPAWAPGANQVWIARLDGRADEAQVLTAEFSSDVVPSVEAMDEETAFLGSVLRIQGREAQAVAAREHLARVLDALRRMPRELEPGPVARALAASAAELAGGTGAAVVSWRDDGGRVLVVLGEDGGPSPGSTVSALESEVALAVRNESAIVRESRKPGAGGLPVVSRGERWHAEPTSLAAYPLRDQHGTVGALVVWDSSRPRLDPDGRGVLEAILPYAAFQLRHALSFGELRQHADLDSLTGLANRRTFEERLRSECARALRYQRPLALLLLDLDHFKEINDSHGHSAGDAVLSAVGQLVRATVRDADVPARFGGEELAVLMPETGLPEALDVAERLRRLIAGRSIRVGGSAITVRASAGVSAFPACVAEPEALILSADEALYAAKAAGRNQVVAAPSAPRAR